MSLTLMLTYPFMQRALIAGTLVSLCAALLGVPLVLKRYSMIGDGLSHVSFGALAIAVALGFTPLYFSIPVVILAAFFLLRLATNPRWNSDAAIAVMSASALAVGIIVISRTSGMTTDVDNYMFGSVLAMTWADVALSAVLSLAVLALFVLFYHKLFAVTFDESFSRATGLRVDWYNTLLAILTALTIVLGMRMMGAMLISSLVIFPALTAMRLFKSFRGVVVCAAVTSVCCFCAGLMASWTLSTRLNPRTNRADAKTAWQQSCRLFFTSPFFFSAYKTGVYQSLQCDIVCIGYCLFHHRCLFEIQLRQKRDQCGHHFVYAYNQWDGTADPGTKSRPCRGRRAERLQFVRRR